MGLKSFSFLKFKRYFGALTILLLLPSLPTIAASSSCTLAFERLSQVVSKTDALSVSQTKQVNKYLKDTFESLRLLRGENGLIRDKIEVTANGIRALNELTSPTNIALDIMILLERSQKPELAVLGKEIPVETLQRILNTLEAAPVHDKTKLFYSWYTTTAGTPVAKSLSVSAVDNIHLALALWTIKEAQPSTTIGKSAARLFNRMDFSAFVDLPKGLLHGNMKYDNGHWITEAYHYGNLGSEARSVYSVGYALGLFRELKKPDAFIDHAILALRAEVSQTPEGNILKLWDGGAFQLLLPQNLIGESRYSSTLAESFETYPKYILNEAKRKELNIEAAGLSASNFGIEGKSLFDGFPDYAGHSGNLALVSKDNDDVLNSGLRNQWESVVTPHAIALAAAENPKLMLGPLSRSESLGVTPSLLYKDGFGWMDGIHVNGTYIDKVVPAQLSLNQGMIGLSMMRILDEDGLSVSARMLEKNAVTQKRLKHFYDGIDLKMKLLK